MSATTQTTIPAPEAGADKEVLKSKEIRKGGEEIATLKIVRKGGKLLMNLKCNKLIEDMFKNPTVKTSNVYKVGNQKLEFYELTPIVEKVEKLAYNFQARIGNYGGYFKDGNNYYNYSLIRTKGISDGITLEVTELVSLEILQAYCENFKKFIVDLFRNYVRDAEISTTITMKNV